MRRCLSSRHVEPGQSSDNGNTPLPEHRRRRQIIQNASRPRQKVLSNDVRGGSVHQVPVIRPVGVLEVEVEDLLTVAPPQPRSYCATRISRAAKRCSWIGDASSFAMSVSGKMRIAQGDLSAHWNRNSKKNVAFAIFSRAGLEEPREIPRLALVGDRLQLAQQVETRSFSSRRSSSHGIGDSDSRVSIVFSRVWRHAEETLEKASSVQTGIMSKRASFIG